MAGPHVAPFAGWSEDEWTAIANFIAEYPAAGLALGPLLRLARVEPVVDSPRTRISPPAASEAG